MRYLFNAQPIITLKAIWSFAKYSALLIIPFIFFGCEKDKPQDFLIRSIDMEALALKYLPDFSLIEEGPNWMFYEYRFERSTDSAFIIIRTYICSSTAQTDSIVALYFNNISGVYNEGPFNGDYVGSRFWWMSYQSPEYPSHITFIRENVILVFIEFKYKDLIDLAKEIDYDILHIVILPISCTKSLLC